MAITGLSVRSKQRIGLNDYKATEEQMMVSIHLISLQNFRMFLHDFKNILNFIGCYFCVISQ